MGGDSEVAAVFNDIHKLICAADQFLLHADHVYVLLLVLPDLQLCSLVEQVVQPPAVNLVETDCHVQMPEPFLNDRRRTS